jgi:hypothetical protein
MSNKIRYSQYYVGDFETTVYEGQEYTEVWASALVPFWSEDVQIFSSISDTFNAFKKFKNNTVVYYHNLKFDGSFWLNFLIEKTELKQALFKTGDNELDVSFYEPNEMPNNSFKYSISSMGDWYTITLKINNIYIEIRDSLKLLPFSVRKIGKSFATKHKKLEMEYEGFRYAGCKITDEEKQYIANDVLVVKEALEIMFNQGHKKLTIGSCCLTEFRQNFFGGKQAYKGMFPDLTLIKCNKEKYGDEDVDSYVRRSYRGGWCYLVKGKECKIFNNGTTADVNSLYPSVMHSDSGNKYPVGKPKFWKGNYIPLQAIGNNKYYFIRIRTEFKIKEGKLPCIQIKHDPLYKTNEWLETSDVTLHARKVKGKYYEEEVIKHPVTLTLTETDFELINDQYDLINLEILDGCFFSAEVGIFDEYINKYRDLKIVSTDAIREICKLFLNNLYGKLATSPYSSFKVCEVENGVLKFHTVHEKNKKTVFIPAGSAVTSYARNFTIRAAQKNYYGADKRGFIYADTDSIHCDLLPEEIKGIKVHDTAFLHWKLESCWEQGWFVRQKTYIEKVVKENLKEVEKPYYNIKCAGMGDGAKKFFIYSMEGLTEEQWKTERAKEWNKMHKIEKQYVLEKREITDFKSGFKSVGKLIPKRVRGGVVLCLTTYELR